MTRAEWDAECTREIGAYIRAGMKAEQAMRAANERTTRLYGPRPEKPRDLSRPGIVGVVKLGLQVRRLKMQKPSVAAVTAAIAGAASAVGAAYAIANGDGSVSTVELIAVVWAGLSALIAGLFTSPSAKQ